MKHLLLDASYSHLHRDHCLSAVNELEGGFSCWGFGCSSVSPQDIGYRDGNFALPAPPRPAPQRWWGGDGAIFCPRTMGRGGDGFSIFIPNPPHLASPRPHTNKDYNCKFSNKNVVSLYWEKAKLILKELVNFYLL